MLHNQDAKIQNKARSLMLEARTDTMGLKGSLRRSYVPYRKDLVKSFYHLPPKKTLVTYNFILYVYPILNHTALTGIPTTPFWTMMPPLTAWCLLNLYFMSAPRRTSSTVRVLKA